MEGQDEKQNKKQHGKYHLYGYITNRAYKSYYRELRNTIAHFPIRIASKVVLMLTLSLSLSLYLEIRAELP